jgi:hypothetical protein
MRLIDDWRRAWRFLSVQTSGAALTLWACWMALPADQQAGVLQLLHLDPGRWIPALGLISTLVSRLIRQPELHPPPDVEPRQVNPGV